jgi:Icc-related predicted phosphoesterase
MMKFVTISDTHGHAHKLDIPKGDVLIHAGDISMDGKEAEVMGFLHWFAQQDFEHKIFIAGNHDFFFERTADDTIRKVIPEGVTYLKDSGIVVNGYKIWGSPVTPWFHDWAFNLPKGAPLCHHWNLIPDDTDVLITHGPSAGILDTNEQGDHLGCIQLLKRVRVIKPQVHVFGHIHTGYGNIKKGNTRFINASVVNDRYELMNKPIVFEL